MACRDDRPKCLHMNTILVRERTPLECEQHQYFVTIFAIFSDFHDFEILLCARHVCVCVNVSVCMCVWLCVCDTFVCGTRMLVRERTRVGMNNARKLDNFRHFPKISRNFENVVLQPPDLDLAQTFSVCLLRTRALACHKLYKTSRFWEKLTAYDYFSIASINIPLCYK